MDRRSWLWKRKSTEKSPGETESFESVSSFSEKYFDDQESLRSSTQNAQPTEVSSNLGANDERNTVKELTAKLSNALLSIQAKEDLVKQHAKVAEEAVAGWEKAESEVSTLKHQLEISAQTNSTLEDKIGQLDGALKECIRKLRQEREEQEIKIHDALVEKISEWIDEKSELENRVVELEAQLETRTTDTLVSVNRNHNLQIQLEELEKENSSLKLELRARDEKLKKQALEMELSNRAAEAASKHHLESIKKVTRVESECRKLRAMTRKMQSHADHSHSVSSVCGESFSDSQSDISERVPPSDICLDSWALPQTAPVDQAKCENKNIGKGSKACSMDIGTLDDFLEMERLAALPEANHVSDKGGFGESGIENVLSLAEFESMKKKTVELEEKISSLENLKADLQDNLTETKERLQRSLERLKEAEDESSKLKRQLSSAQALKQNSDMELKASEAKIEKLEFQLEELVSEAHNLREKIKCLEEKSEEKSALSEEFSAKCQELEAELLKRKETEAQQTELQRAESIEMLKKEKEKELALAAGKFAECQKTILSLGLQLRSLASSEEFILEPEKFETGSPPSEATMGIIHGSSAEDLAQLSSPSSSLEFFRNPSTDTRAVVI